MRSLARQRRRAERHAELMSRRFTVELALAKREMEAWSDELARLDQRVVELRGSAPQSDQSVSAAEQARDAAHGARAAAEAQRTELLRLVSTQREQVQQIRAEMAVAEERQRNALARRQVQLPRGMNEQVRRRLLPLDAIAVRDGIERMPDSKPVHHLARVLARRTESRLEPCPANFVE